MNPGTNGNKITNALTIDVEDYFMVSAFEDGVAKSDWIRFEDRVGRSTMKILEILDARAIKGTFFVVGWIGERNPALVREIHARGHEVACHGFYHELAYRFEENQFRADVRRAKAALEAAIGERVAGYRAPSFSIGPENAWALDVLAEEGFAYDASVLPAPHARGGFEGTPRFPYRTKRLMEFPMSTLRFAGRLFPFSGGGYFRLFPYAVVRHGIRAANREGFPAIVYLHPWEFDPDQPRLPASPLNRFKHYVNLHKTESKFRRLVSEFPFAPCRDVLSAASLADTPRPLVPAAR